MILKHNIKALRTIEKIRAEIMALQARVTALKSRLFGVDKTNHMYLKVTKLTSKNPN